MLITAQFSLPDFSTNHMFSYIFLISISYNTNCGKYSIYVNQNIDMSMSNMCLNFSGFLGVQVSRNVDYSTMSMTQRPWCGVPDIANYQLCPGEPKWEKNTWMHRWWVVAFLALEMSRHRLDDLKGLLTFFTFCQCCLLFLFQIFNLRYKFSKDFVMSLYDFARNY